MVKGKKQSEREIVRNRDKRDKFIKAHGEAEFERISAVDGGWARMKDLPCPVGFLWLWEHFMNIWNECERDFNGNVVLTYRSILDYAECMGVPLNAAERATIMKMKHWALAEISELNKEEE